MKNIIYYFSGTGNSLAIALSIAKKIPDTTVEPIINLNNNGHILESYEKIGFVYPCYYVHPPKLVTDIIKNVLIYKKQKIFLVVTFAGKYGYSLSDMISYLDCKTNYSIQGFSVRMPGSHILGYPAFPKSLQQILFNKSKRKIDKIVYQIQNDLPTRLKESSFLEKQFSKVKSKKLMRFNEMGTLFSVMDNCNKCGTCAKICPLNNINISSLTVNWGNHCQQCMACIQWCPRNAITYPKISPKRMRYHHPDIKVRQMINSK